jgi:hypothetical protein
MSSYTESNSKTQICASCGKENHVVLGYAGVSAANELEMISCFSCGGILAEVKCFRFATAASAEIARAKIRAEY